MNEQFTLSSWNVRGGGRRVTQQCVYLVELNPDIMALQEVTLSSIPVFKQLLEGPGYAFIEDSILYVVDAAELIGPRK